MTAPSGVDRRGVLRAVVLSSAVLAATGAAAPALALGAADGGRDMRWRPVGLPSVRHMASRVEARVRPGEYVGVGSPDNGPDELVMWRGLDIRSHTCPGTEIRRVWANRLGDVVGEARGPGGLVTGFVLPSGASKVTPLAVPDGTRVTQLGGVTEDGYIPAVLDGGAGMVSWSVDEPDRCRVVARPLAEVHSVVGVFADHTWVLNRRGGRGYAATWREGFHTDIPYHWVHAVGGSWMSVVDVYGGFRNLRDGVSGPAFELDEVRAISATGLVVGLSPSTRRAAVCRDDEREQVIPGRSDRDRVRLVSVTEDDELLGCVNRADPMVWRHESR